MRNGRIRTTAVANNHSSLGWASLGRDRLVNMLFAVTLVVLAVPPLYLAKSALGIDLMPGPSPLHELLYWMVR